MPCRFEDQSAVFARIVRTNVLDGKGRQWMKRCLGAGLALAILASAGMVVRVAAAEPVAV